MRVLIKVFMLLCFVTGMWQLGTGALIVAKAHAATFLISDAWSITLDRNTISKPWPWADTWPVAELTIPSIDFKEIVLSGDSGSSLAFGPGLSNAGSTLDEEGVKLISGHRDTHFKSLKDLAIDDEIVIKTPVKTHYYRIMDIRIVDSSKYSIDSTTSKYDLMLATCYPFDSLLAGGSKRFLVQAYKI